MVCLKQVKNFFKGFKKFLTINRAKLDYINKNKKPHSKLF